MTVKRRIGLAQPFQIGWNAWHILPGAAAHGILEVGHGRVVQVRLVDKRLTATSARQLFFLRCFPAIS